jgi:hypothetical protein
VNDFIRVEGGDEEKRADDKRSERGEGSGGWAVERVREDEDEEE